MLIKNIFRSKFIFKKENRADILLLDQNYASLNFSNKKVKVMNFNEINIYYILLAFFYLIFPKKNNPKSFNKLYRKYIYLDIDAQLAIGHEINFKIFTYKELLPHKKTIVYQHGFYWDVHADRTLDHYSKIKSDYFFVFDKWHKKIFKNVKTKFIVNGSTKNNEINITKNKKKYDLMFISEFRNLDLNNAQGPSPLIKKNKKGYFSHTFANNSPHMRYKDVVLVYILKLLNEYCNENKKKICVARSSLRKEKINKVYEEDEKIFYDEYLNNYYTENINSYELSEKSELVICLSSNMGPELLARGKKVLFLNANTLINDWHFLKSDLGPFWYKGKDPKIIKDKINFMLRLSQKKWMKILQKSRSQMIFDKGNKKIKKIIYQIVK